MNNLEPRAKIGDVVIVRGYEVYNEYTGDSTYKKDQREFIVGDSSEHNYVESRNIYYDDNFPEVDFTDKDILKNLTTNISYE